MQLLIISQDGLKMINFSAVNYLEVTRNKYNGFDLVMHTETSEDVFSGEILATYDKMEQVQLVYNMIATIMIESEKETELIRMPKKEEMNDNFAMLNSIYGMIKPMPYDIIGC